MGRSPGRRPVRLEQQQMKKHNLIPALAGASAAMVATASAAPIVSLGATATALAADVATVAGLGIVVWAAFKSLGVVIRVGNRLFGR